jgi:hypothetical protein
MTAAWVVYALLMSAFIGLMAVALERVCAIWTFPRRGLWVLAIVVATVAPFIARRSPPAVPTVSVASGRARAMPRAAVARRVPGPVVITRSRLAMIWVLRTSRRIERPVRELWLAASLLVLCVFARAVVGVARQRAQWTRVSLGRDSAWLAPDLGPAVVGALQPQIVLPRWALTLDENARELMLLHEREHIRAGDPRVLLGAGLLLIVFPWNAALWWMVRRLRLAIEVDCDARVIGAVGRRYEYGMLLVAVGERKSGHLHLATSLAQQQPFLERRIHAMTAPRPRYPLIASLPFAAVALAASVAVAQTPVPPTAAGGFVARATMMDSLSTRSAELQRQVRELVAAHYPGVMDGTSTARHIAFVLDANDALVTSSASNVDVPAPASATMSRSTAGGGAGASAGGFMAASGGAGTRVMVSNGSDTVATARAVAGAGRFTGPLDLTRYGLGTIDRSLIRSSSASSFRAGVLGPNAVDVYIVRLNTTASGKK